MLEFILQIVIVDRDEKALELIKAYIEKSRRSIQILKICNDGYAAMEAIKKLEPDLVFTEINMENMDGISLIKEAYERDITSDFVICSDLKSFEAAQIAMRYGVEEYLVKPLLEEDFIRVIEKYLYRKYAYSESVIVNDRLFRTRQALRNSFMDGFTSFSKQTRDYRIAELNEKYHFRFQEGIFQIVSVLLDKLPDEEKGTFLPELAEEIRARFDPLCFEMVPYVQENQRMTLLLNYSEKVNISNRLDGLSDILKEYIKKRSCLQVSYCIGIGEPERDISNLFVALVSSEKAARCGILRGRNKVFRYEQLIFDEIRSIDILTSTLLNDLYKTAAILDMDGFAKAIRYAFSPITPYCDSAVVIDITHAVIDTVIEVGNKEGYGEVSETAISYVHHRLGDAMTLGETVSVLINWSKDQFNTFRQNMETHDNSSRVIRMAKKYIAQYYMNPITLKEVAEHVHLNASYFSIIFKKETGQNFSNYLRDYRIEEAKRILRDSEVSINAVSNSVGYTDRKYFSKIFTQVVGVKPSEYRNRR